MRLPLTLAALALVAACEAPSGLPAGAEAVPFAQVLEETAGRPYECVAYDPVSQTCEAVATNRVEGAGFRSDATILVSADPRVEVRGSGVGIPDGNRTCLDFSTYEVDIVGPGVTAFMEELIRAEIDAEAARIGTLCSTYIRAGGGYIVQTTDGAGRPVEGYDDEVVTFLADRPALRVPALPE